MKNEIVIIGDSHIQESNIEELNCIFNEIKSYINNNCIIVSLGDWYNSKRPTAKEVEFGTDWAIQFYKTANTFYMIRGNHTMVNFDYDDNSVEYLKHIGIKVVEDLIYDNMYFGHKMTELSDMFFGLEVPNLARYHVDTKELEKYTRSFLGHQHKFQIINNNIYHPGSILFYSFNEIGKSKCITKIKNGKVAGIFLKSPIPMVDVYDINMLDDIEEKTKVRLIFTSFEDFKNGINRYQKYKNRFHLFKIKNTFQKESINIKKEDDVKRKNLVKKWLNNIKDKDVKKELEIEFEKNSINNGIK